MSKRRWTNIKAIEAGIIIMRQEGRTRQEIADHFGLDKRQIKDWVRRYNQEQARLAVGLPAKRRGRPRKGAIVSEAEYQYEINRLRMENCCPYNLGLFSLWRAFCFLPPIYPHLNRA